MLGEIKRKHSGNKPTVWIEKVTGNKVTHNKNNFIFDDYVCDG